MSRRFFVDQRVTTDQVRLVADEGRHLARVHRAKIGDTVTLFDGSGYEFTARITHIDRDTVDLQVLARDEPDRELTFELMLGVALPKGDRQKWLIEKAVELGVTRVVPLKTRRGVAQPLDRALERLRRTVVEASKQCGRNRLMAVDKPESLSRFADRAPVEALRLVAHPHRDAVRVKPSMVRSSDAPVFIAVGPEGGFTEDEIATMETASWLMVSLGPRTLRIETATLALAACFAIPKPNSAHPAPGDP